MERIGSEWSGRCIRVAAGVATGDAALREKTPKIRALFACDSSGRQLVSELERELLPFAVAYVLCEFQRRRVER
jgi:hypothetical protein